MRTHPIFAACYDRMNTAAERHFLAARRTRLLSELTGRVLDVGAGTGANLAHLRQADHVVAAEPDGAMRKRLRGRLDSAPVPVTVRDAGAESLPFDTGSFDAVVCTLVLCTVGAVDRALAEFRRVLAPEGRLVLLEHVRGQGRFARYQELLDPLWTTVSGGCHLARNTGATVRGAGFTFTDFEEFTELPRWMPPRPMFQGTAVLQT